MACQQPQRCSIYPLVWMYSGCQGLKLIKFLICFNRERHVKVLSPIMLSIKIQKILFIIHCKGVKMWKGRLQVMTSPIIFPKEHSLSRSNGAPANLLKPVQEAYVRFPPERTFSFSFWCFCMIIFLSDQLNPRYIFFVKELEEVFHEESLIVESNINYTKAPLLLWQTYLGPSNQSCPSIFHAKFSPEEISQVLVELYPLNHYLSVLLSSVL